MAKWHKNEFDEAFYLEKENGRLVCGIHPKPTREYALHLAKKLFNNNRDLNSWYNHPNYWYGDIAPIDMSDNELIDKIMQIEYSVYI